MGGKPSSLHHDHFVAPYIHAMACHVGDFIRVHGGILPFTQQGMEKLNDVFLQRSIFWQQTIREKWH